MILCEFYFQCSFEVCLEIWNVILCLKSEKIISRKFCSFIVAENNPAGNYPSYIERFPSNDQFRF